MWDTKVTAKRIFTVQQDVGHEKHIQAMQLASKKKSTQLLLQETASMKDNKSSDFHKNFCETIVSANIPFSTLNNDNLKSFLELHFGHLTADESSMVQLYQRMCKGVSPDTKMCFPTTGVPKLSIICASWWLCFCNNAQ